MNRSRPDTRLPGENQIAAGLDKIPIPPGSRRYGKESSRDALAESAGGLSVPEARPSCGSEYCNSERVDWSPESRSLDRHANSQYRLRGCSTRAAQSSQTPWSHSVLRGLEEEFFPRFDEGSHEAHSL